MTFGLSSVVKKIEARQGFGMLPRHFETLPPDNISFCDERTGSVHVCKGSRELCWLRL